MKVAMVETGGWGGIAHYAWNLCQGLTRAGIEVVLYTNEVYELAEMPRSFELRRCLSGADRYPRAAARLRRAISDGAPHVLHLQSLLSTRFDGLLWSFLHRPWPIVFTIHNVRSHERSAWDDWTIWRLVRTADALVVHTRESAELVPSRVGPRPHVGVIPMGDLGFFAPTKKISREVARVRLGLPFDGPLLLAFGAIRPYKGLLGIIQAMSRVVARAPGVRLLIAGPLLAGTEAEYRRAIVDSGVGDRIVFRPTYVPHESVAAHFAASDIAVFNYREVTDSAAVRLPCSLGTPIVATNVGSFREFLHDGVTARLVSPDDPPALAGAILELLQNAGLASQLAANARRLSQSAWSWDAIAASTIELYRRVVDPPEASAAETGLNHRPAGGRRRATPDAGPGSA
ncbi:MAG TPA: glycosyltransferase family 4 protein [Candidatus Acidoferrum sp.]|nr:glycosyltransferase family 4 protein [Candidatus Acidoferrum sp.]